MTLELALALIGWGTVVGLDLVSVPQAMIARPIVAGPVAGLLLGDPQMGVALGILLELFQYEVLPVGAVRYPEYGPATIAAVAAAADIAGPQGFALGAVVGMVTAMVGGASITLLRRVNTRAVHAAAGALDGGDTRALVSLHAASIGRDALRAAAVTVIGLALALAVRPLAGGAFWTHAGVLMSAAVIGAGLATGAAGTLRLVGRGPELRWLAGGVGVGVLVAVLR